MRKVVDYEVHFGEKPEKTKKPVAASLLYEWMDSVIIALIVLMMAFLFVFRIAGVDGSSMYPTLKDGNWVIISSFSQQAEHGDIIISAQPNYPKPIIKRVIGVGGDTVDIDFSNHTVSVNGEILYEPYINEPTVKSYDVEFPLVVPEGYVFVMGDNRNGSLDSRSSDIGLIDERYILGKATFKAFPFGSLTSDK